MLRRALITRLGAVRRLLAALPPPSLPAAAHQAALPAATSVILTSAFHAAGAPSRTAGAQQEPSPKVDADVTSALASAADSGEAFSSSAAAHEQVEEGEQLSLEDYQQLSPDDFAAVADLYIGGLWNRIERGLREAEGEARSLKEFSYEVKPERGAMLVLLPYDGQLVIRKDPQHRMLVVESNLYEPFEDKDRQEFRPCGENCWANEDGESIIDFVSSALSKYLRANIKV